MFCTQTCDTKRTLYAVPLEPLPDPALFTECQGPEECDASSGSAAGPSGPGCLFDDFDPDLFDKPCCKSGCCVVCDRIGDDAPYLVPHILACTSIRNHFPWDSSMWAPGGSQEEIDEAKHTTVQIEIKISGDDLPECLCDPSAGFEVLCIRARGVPNISFGGSDSGESFENDPNGFTLTVRPTIYLEVLLRDCCGYLYTIKTSYKFPDSMLLVFNLRCKLCTLGGGQHLYVKTKVQLCDSSGSPPVIDPSTSSSFTFDVNLALDACVVMHVPYDMCYKANPCLRFVANGPGNITDTEDPNAIDTPYLVPYAVACRRLRSRRLSGCNDCRITKCDCPDLPVIGPPPPPNTTITLPDTLPGSGPWKVIAVGANGHTNVEFDEDQCDNNVLTFHMTARLSVVLRDHNCEIYVTVVDYVKDLSIKLGTSFRNLCRMWLYLRTKFTLCERVEITEGGDVSLPLDILIETCAMKMIPYQVTGRNPHCNLGPWYTRNFCKYPMNPESIGVRQSRPRPDSVKRDAHACASDKVDASRVPPSPKPTRTSRGLTSNANNSGVAYRRATSSSCRQYW